MWRVRPEEQRVGFWRRSEEIKRLFDKHIGRVLAGFVVHQRAVLVELEVGVTELLAGHHMPIGITRRNMLRSDFAVAVHELADMADMIAGIGKPYRQRVVLQRLIDGIATELVISEDAVIVRLQAGQHPRARRRTEWKWQEMPTEAQPPFA